MKHWFNVAAIVLILALAFGLYKSKTDAEAARARIADLSKEVSETRAEVRALRAEAAHLESPAHIEELARQNLEIGRRAEIRAESDIASALPTPRRQ